MCTIQHLLHMCIRLDENSSNVVEFLVAVTCWVFMQLICKSYFTCPNDFVEKWQHLFHFMKFGYDASLKITAYLNYKKVFRYKTIYLTSWRVSWKSFSSKSKGLRLFRVFFLLWPLDFITYHVQRKIKSIWNQDMIVISNICILLETLEVQKT